MPLGPLRTLPPSLPTGHMSDTRTSYPDFKFKLESKSGYEPRQSLSRVGINLREATDAQFRGRAQR